jgi:hypothetical protein
MFRLRFASLILTIVAVSPWMNDRAILADQPRVQFDLPAVAVAHYQVDMAPTKPSTIPSNWKRVEFELRLSCINKSLAGSPMRQCTVRVQPRDTSLQVVDYAPRTEIASELSTPIQIKRIDENTRSMGIALDGGYSSLAHGNLGSDNANKKTESVQYDRVAPVQAVIASGTFERGRGVYFKMLWTDTRVLEGEHCLKVVLGVPGTWRGELVDVSVVAEAEQRSLTNWESQLKPIAAANFIVATYLHGDAEAELFAHQLATTEYRLRESAMKLSSRQPPTTLPQMLRHVAMKMDIDTPSTDTTWLARLFLGQADPHVDKTIRQLPADLRVIALDYVDTRDDFKSLCKQPQKDLVVESLVGITNTEAKNAEPGE